MIGCGRSGTCRPLRRHRIGTLIVLAVTASLVSVLASVGPTTGTPPSPTIGPRSGTVLASASGPDLSSGPVPSVSASDWINVTPTGPGTAPPSEYAAASAYDPLAHATVLFGGCSTTECPSNQTWTFSNGVWSNQTPRSGSPPAREFATMDYDANMGGLLLFGGFGGLGELNDTWLYSGGVWTNLSYVGPAPSARYGAVMAFDPAPEENGSVLFGGCDFFVFAIGCSNDTWVWQGWSGWTPLAPSFPPPAVGFATMAYDPFSESLVLYGGCLGPYCASYSNGTWELAAGQWSEIGTLSSPGARSGATAVYDPVGARIVLFGGYDDGSYASDTWAFSDGQWANITPAHSPSAREYASAMIDPTGATVLLFGGESSAGSLNDTWALEVPPTVAIATPASTSETSAPVSWTVNVTGGTAPYEVLVAFGDGAVEALAGAGPTFVASHAFGALGAFVAQVNLTDAVGALAHGASSSVTVTAGPEISADATPAVTDLGVATTLSAGLVTGATGPVTYAWSFGDGTTGAGPSVSHVYPRVGTFGANVTATDALGGVANASLTVLVNRDPTLAPTTLRAAPNSSSTFVFHSGLDGGSGPDTFTWRFGDGGASSVPSPTHRYANNGVYEVQLWVNDSVGATAQANLSVSVTGAGPTGASGAATFPWWFWAGLAGLAVVAVAGVWLLRRASRSGG
jgi:PKD domain/Galactose oxidase, central domain